MALKDMMFILPVVLLVSKVDFTEPLNALIARATFLIVHASIAAILAKIYFAIQKKNDQTKITVKDQATGTESVQTIAEYDISQIRQQAQRLGVTLLIICGLHFYFGLFPPLAVQCVLNPLNMYKFNLFKEYILGQTVPPRPWVEEKPFAFGAPAEEEKKEEETKNKDEVGEGGVKTMAALDKKND